MKLKESNELIEAIITSANSSFEAEKIITELKKLRELALKEEDPLVTKIIRLVYENLEENDSFEVELDLEELDLEEDTTSVELFNHFMSLLVSPENKYNREELQIIKHALLGRPYVTSTEA